jgi:uncharacterized spore protein YtfJ
MEISKKRVAMQAKQSNLSEMSREGFTLGDLITSSHELLPRAKIPFPFGSGSSSLRVSPFFEDRVGYGNTCGKPQEVYTGNFKFSTISIINL